MAKKVKKVENTGEEKKAPSPKAIILKFVESNMTEDGYIGLTELRASFEEVLQSILEDETKFYKGTIPNKAGRGKPKAVVCRA